jgi:acetylornithine deacetylase
MKGGLAAILGAARRIGQNGLDAGELIVAAVVDEEHSSLGAEALVRQWRADAAVVTEPTSLDVAVAHKGFQWMTVETRGRARARERPRTGATPSSAWGVLSALERLERASPRVRCTRCSARCTRSSRAVRNSAAIQPAPGSSSNAARCRRSGSAALDELDAILDELRASDPEFECGGTLLSRTRTRSIRPHHCPIS